MAEKGAHLSATFVKKPSIFELIAQDSLATTFYPALKQIVQFLFSRNPLKYGFFYEWFEEFYSVFNFLMQSHYLKNYDATFAERFYSLRRISINSRILNENLQLTPKQRYWSLLFCVLFPYIRNKVKSMVKNIENGEEFKNSIRISRKHEETFLLLFKSFHVFFESLCVIYYLRYMTGRSETHSVSLRMAGVTLTYFHDKSPGIFGWKIILKEIYSGNWRSCFTLFTLLRNAFGHGLELCAFFIQFLNWWHAEQFNTKFFAYPIPSPPHEKAKQGIILPKDTCPICKTSFKIPTALPVSGYVFCFSCIRKFVSQNRKCPVTNLPADEGDLIRIYADLNAG